MYNILSKENINETNEIWRDTIEAIIDPSYGMDEEEESCYLNKIMTKLKNGKNLTSEELNYLKLHNPQLYMTALRVKYKKQAVENQLKHCKSKEEAQEVIDCAIGGIGKDDPDKEYLIAGIRETEKEFKESKYYKRLPEKKEESERKKIKDYLYNKNNNKDSDDEESIFQDENITPIAELLDILPVFEARA